MEGIGDVLFIIFVLIPFLLMGGYAVLKLILRIRRDNEVANKQKDLRHLLFLIIFIFSVLIVFWYTMNYLVISSIDSWYWLDYVPRIFF